MSIQLPSLSSYVGTYSVPLTVDELHLLVLYLDLQDLVVMTKSFSHSS
jgi:hypothetical protein